MMAAARFLVSGKAQGVFCRVLTREQVPKLGLSAHAVNMDDGCAEVVEKGAGEAVEALASWLRRGPPMARVDGMERSACGEFCVWGFCNG